MRWLVAPLANATVVNIMSWRSPSVSNPSRCRSRAPGGTSESARRRHQSRLAVSGRPCHKNHEEANFNIGPLNTYTGPQSRRWTI